MISQKAWSHSAWTSILLDCRYKKELPLHSRLSGLLSRPLEHEALAPPVCAHRPAFLTNPVYSELIMECIFRALWARTWTTWVFFCCCCNKKYFLDIICTVVRVKIKGTACCLYNVYTVVTTSHGITSLALSARGYTTAKKLYQGKMQGVGIHSTSHLYYSHVVVYFNLTVIWTHT